MAREKAGSAWSDAEKIQLLFEIAKQNTNPNWRLIGIPSGRTKVQAQQLFTAMKTMHSQPEPVNPKKRRNEELQTFEDANIQSTHGQSSASALETPVTKRKRGRPTKAETERRKAAEARGEILPKPKPYVPKTTSSVVMGPDGQMRRRRGRPTKAEAEAKKAREKEMKRKQQEDEQKQAARILGNSGQSDQQDDLEEEEDELEDDE